jgi:hypothetical protein
MAHCRHHASAEIGDASIVPSSATAKNGGLPPAGASKTQAVSAALANRLLPRSKQSMDYNQYLNNKPNDSLS